MAKQRELAAAQATLNEQRRLAAKWDRLQGEVDDLKKQLIEADTTIEEACRDLLTDVC